MAIKKNRSFVILLAVLSLAALAACTSPPPATPTPNPTPTATATPIPVEAIKIDPRLDPDAFLAALPKAEVDCAASAVGSVEVLAELVAFPDAPTVDVSDTQLKVLASCISGDTVQKVVIGQLELETGGLSASSSACVATHTDGINFGSLFAGQVSDSDTIVSTLQALFCLSAEERRALESSDQEIIDLSSLGGIDALECAIDGAGPTGIESFGSMFGSDGEVNVLAVSELMPLLIDCGVVSDSTLGDSAISVDQFSCLFEQLDPETLNSFLAIADDPNATPDLSGAVELLSAFTACGIDLQDLVDSSEPPGGQPGGGVVVSSELPICLSDNGVNASLAANYAAGLADASDPMLAAALAACEGGNGGGSSGGIVVPGTNGGSTTIDPSVFDSLPITAEQAQCLIDEIGPEQIEGLADGTTSPLALLGPLATCNISIADLIAG